MNNTIPIPLSFTTHYSKITRVLRSEVLISPAFDPNKEISTPHKHTRFDAIWDTGATQSLITKNVVEQCGLETIDITEVSTASGISRQNVYLINMILRNNVGVSMVRVTEGQLTDGVDALIGMDIISQGDFAVCNKDGHTTLSFRIPSVECIDFVNPQPVYVPPVPGRNDPCPCGSGKKYKYCHGK